VIRALARSKNTFGGEVVMMPLHRCRWFFANRHRLGAVLVDLGMLDEGQLWDVLAESAATGQRTGQIALRMGLITAEQLARAVAEQQQLRQG
jgi:hypothetical protein